MAHKESGLLTVGDRYVLGKYTISLQNVVSEDERVIQAHCSGPEGNAAKGISVPTRTQLEGWYVEANDTSADVYAKTKGIEGKDIPYATGGGTVTFLSGAYNVDVLPGTVKSFTADGQNYWISGSPFEFAIMSYDKYGQYIKTSSTAASATTIRGKPVYMLSWAKSAKAASDYKPEYDGSVANDDLYCLIYGILPPQELLVARFAINLHEAGGSGGDSDWDEPGDDDPGSEDDPTHTLYLRVTGALSGRHNDPLHDTSYHYTPANKTIKKLYGCGGDGGNGGGGGGGASTVVIYKFGTSKAGSKEITATAKRHGYGSGGGKGGKGGDGMVLIYY